MITRFNIRTRKGCFKSRNCNGVYFSWRWAALLLRTHQESENRSPDCSPAVDHNKGACPRQARYGQPSDTATQCCHHKVCVQESWNQVMKKLKKKKKSNVLSKFTVLCWVTLIATLDSDISNYVVSVCTPKIPGCWRAANPSAPGPVSDHVNTRLRRTLLLYWLSEQVRAANPVFQAL